MDKLGKNQEPLFFGKDNRMYGVLHCPSGSGLGRKKRGIIFCSSFGDEFMKTYGQMVSWARELSSLGYFVLRFHYYGTGDSGGDYSQVTLTGMASDIQEAIKFLRNKTGVEEVGLFGFRLGATLAAKAASVENTDSLSDSKVSFLILWSPIINTKNYLESFLRLRIAKELVYQKESQVKFTRADMIRVLESGREVDVIGYAVSSELYKEMFYSNPWSGITRLPEKTLILCRKGEDIQLSTLVEKYKASSHIEFKVLQEKIFWDNVPDEREYLPSNFSKAAMTWLKTILHHDDDHSHDVFMESDTIQRFPSNLHQPKENEDRKDMNIIEEKVVNFTNDAGLKLCGIVHMPNSISKFKQKKIGVVILNAGMRSMPGKMGPHRLYIKAARAFCQQGCYVLRFDFRETGDSQGKLYAPVKVSAKVSDTLAAIRFFKNSFGLDKIILWGYCGATAVAIHCAALLSKDKSSAKDIDALIISSPLFSFRHVFSVKIRQFIEQLAFQNDIITIIKLVPKQIKKYFFPPEEGKHLRGNYIKNFQKAFALYDRPVLFTFGEKDGLFDRFSDEIRKNPSQWHFFDRKHIPKVCVIKDGDRNYASAEQEKTLISEMLQWFHEIFDGLELSLEKETEKNQITRVS